jgi:hypothetical protein
MLEDADDDAADGRLVVDDQDAGWKTFADGGLNGCDAHT